MSQQINLFNPIFLKQKKLFAARTMIEALGLIVLGIAGFALYGNYKVAILQKESTAGAALLAVTQAHQANALLDYVPRQPSKELELQLAGAQAELRALQDVSGLLKRGGLGNTSGYSEYFRALARQSVDGLWLTGVSITGAGQEIVVQGRALQPTLVPEYIGHLMREPAMQGKSFDSLQIARPPDRTSKDAGPASAPFVEFTLQSTMAPEAAGAAGAARK